MNQLGRLLDATDEQIAKIDATAAETKFDLHWSTHVASFNSILMIIQIDYMEL